MHILPPVTAEGYDVSHHPRYAECYSKELKHWHQVFLNRILLIRANRIPCAFYDALACHKE